MPRSIDDPILAYTASGEINQVCELIYIMSQEGGCSGLPFQVHWAQTQPDWIAICFNNCLEILRV